MISKLKFVQSRRFGIRFFRLPSEEGRSNLCFLCALFVCVIQTSFSTFGRVSVRQEEQRGSRSPLLLFADARHSFLPKTIPSPPEARVDDPHRLCGSPNSGGFQFGGVFSGGVPPDPFSNSEVKPACGKPSTEVARRKRSTMPPFFFLALSRSLSLSRFHAPGFRPGDPLAIVVSPSPSSFLLQINSRTFSF